MPELKLATFGMWELVIILLIVIVIFGAGKLPQLGDALGRSIRNFRKSYHDEPQEIPGEVRRVEGGSDQERLNPPAEESSRNADKNSNSKVQRP